MQVFRGAMFAQQDNCHIRRTRTKYRRLDGQSKGMRSLGVKKTYFNIKLKQETSLLGRDIIGAWDRMPMPVIAAIDGFALGKLYKCTHLSSFYLYI